MWDHPIPIQVPIAVPLPSSGHMTYYGFTCKKSSVPREGSQNPLRTNEETPVLQFSSFPFLILLPILRPFLLQAIPSESQVRPNTDFAAMTKEWIHVGCHDERCGIRLVSTEVFALLWCDLFWLVQLHKTDGFQLFYLPSNFFGGPGLFPFQVPTELTSSYSLLQWQKRVSPDIFNSTAYLIVYNLFPNIYCTQTTLASNRFIQDFYIQHLLILRGEITPDIYIYIYTYLLIFYKTPQRGHIWKKCPLILTILTLRKEDLLQAI